MHSGHYLGQMRKLSGMRQERDQLRRERDALQQQVYDLAAKVVRLENDIAVEHSESFEIIHDLHIQIDCLIDRLAARVNG